MKQKKYRNVMMALIGLGVMNIAVAADYSALTTEELMNMRSQTSVMSTQDRDSYLNEMRSRVQSMSDDEKSSLQQMRGQGSGDGSGGGSYGSGYGSRQGGDKHKQ